MKHGIMRAGAWSALLLVIALLTVGCNGGAGEGDTTHAVGSLPQVTEPIPVSTVEETIPSEVSEEEATAIGMETEEETTSEEASEETTTPEEAQTIPPLDPEVAVAAGLSPEEDHYIIGGESSSVPPEG